MADRARAPAQVAGDLLFGADDFVRSWVAARVDGCRELTHGVGIGVLRGDRIVAGVVWSHYDGADMLVIIASDDPRWCRKGTLAGLFAYPYITARCRRTTAVVAESNARSLKLVKGLGYTEEGRLRRKFGDADGLLFGMLREECRWLT